VAGSIDGALLLGLALGSMAVSRRRKHTEPAATDVEVASEATAEGRHPNGSLAAAEPTEEGVHSNGSPAPAEPASESSDAEQSQFPGSHHGRALVIGAGGFAIEALEGCGRSPGFLLVGLRVRDAESGARIGLGQATARTLSERGPQLVWQQAVRWQTGRAEGAKRARIAEGRQRIEVEYAGADPAARQEALTALLQQNKPAPQWQLVLRSLGPAALLWLLHRRVKAIWPETVAVQERPAGESKRPGFKQRVGLSPGQVRAERIGLRAVRAMGIRRSIRMLRRARHAQQQARQAKGHARRTERVVKAGGQGATRARASAVRSWPSLASASGRRGSQPSRAARFPAFARR
jgi:hypothetical protein